MFKSFLLAVALFFGVFDSSVIKKAPVPVAPTFNQVAVQHLADADHVIWLTNALDGGRCTATAVGPHTLLTAAHCYVVTSKIKVDDSVRTIESFQGDGNDHLLIRVSGTPFAALMPIDQREPGDGESIMVLGNPGRSHNVLRFGTFVKAEDDPGIDGDTRQAYWFQLFAAPGDSGAAMVSANGKIIGIVTAGNVADASTFTYRLNFSPAQLASIN